MVGSADTPTAGHWLDARAENTVTVGPDTPWIHRSANVQEQVDVRRAQGDAEHRSRLSAAEPVTPASTMTHVARPSDVDLQLLDAGARTVLANAAASARLEGVEIPVEHEELAAAYLAGTIDADTYRRQIRELTAKELGIDL
jgi:hypothetical protein